MINSSDSKQTSTRFSLSPSRLLLLSFDVKEPLLLEIPDKLG